MKETTAHKEVRRMKRLLLIPLLCLLLLPSVARTVQAADGWPVEQRCVGKATPPLPGWTFPGTILMRGKDEIDAFRGGWISVKTLLSLKGGDFYDFVTDGDLPGGMLSPDGRWYASPYGDRIQSNTGNLITDVKGIRISNLIENGLPHIFHMPDDGTLYQYTHGTYDKIYWIGDHQFLFADYRFDVQSDRILKWSGLTFSSFDLFASYPSPDWNSVLQIYKSKALAFIYEPLSAKLTGTIAVADYRDDDWQSDTLISWMPNSQRYAAEVKDGEQRELAIADSQGSIKDIILKLDSDTRLSAKTSAWSSDGQFFAFALVSDYYVSQVEQPKSLLYIADTQRRLVIDLCLTIGDGLAWSRQQKNLLAFLSKNDEQSDLIVVNMENLLTYNLAPYKGRVIGWRAD